MKILCLNLWNLNEPLTQRMTALEEHLAESHYDLLAFQEVSPMSSLDAELQVERMLQRRGYAIYFQQTGDWKGRQEGLAVASRLPVASYRGYRLATGPRDMDRGLQHAVIENEGRPLHLFNTHLAFRPDDQTLRQTQGDEVASLVRMLAPPNESAVLCGDLNDTPSSACVKGICKGASLISAFSDDQASQSTFASTNPFAAPELVLDRRIDHILVRHVQVKRATLVLDQRDALASDHYGLSAEVVQVP